MRDTEMWVDVSHLDHILDVTESPTRDIWGSRALTVVRVNLPEVDENREEAIKYVEGTLVDGGWRHKLTQVSDQLHQSHPGVLLVIGPDTE